MIGSFLVSYKTKGIKSLEHMVSLSFYKKMITKPIDTQDYNIKGIYGMNGSGKSGIIASVDILRNLLVDKDYLNNPMVQKNLDSIINKKTKELYIEIEFLSNTVDKTLLYNYKIVLKKNNIGKYTIDNEQLSYKPAISRKEEFKLLTKVDKGKIIDICDDEESRFKDLFIEKTTNLLSNATISALFMDNLVDFFDFVKIENGISSILFYSFFRLFLFGGNIYVYMDKSDDHTDYLLNDMHNYPDNVYNDFYTYLNNHSDSIIRSKAYSDFFNTFFDDKTYVRKYNYENFKTFGKDNYKNFEKNVGKLQNFIKIFKSDLIRIDIDRKEDDEFYICSLIMVYESYSINTEFESTGIKKLIKLFAYLQIMVEGGIVFIDEFDSNLHDVYLCALLEYLMDYGKGQLCFTTHNVGPMDVLKRHKKSIEFLSMDHQIYPWIKNGNYSPSKLYKNGMIEGSPFNVDLIDFIGIFDSLDEDE